LEEILRMNLPAISWRRAKKEIEAGHACFHCTGKRQGGVARTPVFGVRGSYLAKAVNLDEAALPSGLGPQV
jgi:hypothetical protein